MPDRTPLLHSDLDTSGRIAQLEARVAALEARVAQSGSAAAISPPTTSDAIMPTAVVASSPSAEHKTLEYEVGENWFARVGILVLAIGGVFMLSLPYAELPAIVPSAAGYTIAVGLFAIAHRWQRAFELVANYFRGAAMALLWFATIRLSFFGHQPVIGVNSPVLSALLIAVLALNLGIAFWRRSPHLAMLALATGYASSIAVGDAWFVLTVIVALPAIVALTAEKMHWTLPVLAVTVLSYATYLTWAMGNPFRGGALHFVTSPALAPAIPILALLILALGSLRRSGGEPDPIVASSHACLNCGLGYGVFLIHTAAAFPSLFVPTHIMASVVLICVAVLFWIRLRCVPSTFFYAMAGYTALSVAIIKASAVPNVFVWLSVESIVVVATAVWFRSRFIVVANFLIYVAIVLGYMVLQERETGISLAIGVVALLSARILNWQKDRLELKTELMRNAYLLSGFIVFPSALYHLAPPNYVGLAWVTLAVVYYSLNLVVRSPKYRWMGHATLLLTTVYLVLPGTGRLDPVHRVVSFLALGTVLLVVSLTFSRLRGRANAESTPER